MNQESRDALGLESAFTLEESMTEMRELANTAGLSVQAEVTQRLNDPNPRTYIGTGKVAEIANLCASTGICTVVFDGELSPRQLKHLENSFGAREVLAGETEGGIKVVDRTALILDIFAQRARTAEGQLQVELALHVYRAPRLTKLWTHLERQSGAGGVGLRGPGERQLEIDKRLLRDKINSLQKKIDEVSKQRELHRRGRGTAGLPILSLVGYTNAGKSTLLNYLTSAGVFAEDALFATLDPTTRKVSLPTKAGTEVLLTDTVGFIQKLPTTLVAAFRATLEEVNEADVLVHVVDVSNPLWEKQTAAVATVLDEIGCGDKPVITVFNKIDLVGFGTEDLVGGAAEVKGDCVAISSTTGAGMQNFFEAVESALDGLLAPVDVLLPYGGDGSELLNAVHDAGVVDEADYAEDGVRLKGRAPRALAGKLRRFAVDGKGEQAGEKVDPWRDLARGRH